MKVLVIMPENPTLPKLQVWNEFNKLSAVTLEPPTLLGAERATIDGVAEALRQSYEVIIWSGHGDVGRLAVSDGFVSGEWLAAMLRQAPPSVIVLAACMSAVRDSEALDDIAGTISGAGINTVGMSVSVEDTAAITYNREFLRSLCAGNGIGVAHRVAVRQVAMTHPQMAGAAVLVPGLLNGYGKIKTEIRGIHDRLNVMQTDIDQIKRTIAR